MMAHCTQQIRSTSTMWEKSLAAHVHPLTRCAVFTWLSVVDCVRDTFIVYSCPCILYMYVHTCKQRSRVAKTWMDITVSWSSTCGLQQYIKHTIFFLGGRETVKGYIYGTVHPSREPDPPPPRMQPCWQGNAENTQPELSRGGNELHSTVLYNSTAG